MDLQIEPNQRFGYGYQIRMMDGPECEVYDDEPLILAEALISMQEAMDGMNLEEGINYQLRKVAVQHVLFDGTVRAGRARSPSSRKGAEA